MSDEIKNLIENQGKAFAAYQAQMAEVQKQQAATGEETGKILAMLADYDQNKERLDNIQADLSMVKDSMPGSKKEDIKAKERRDSFMAFARRGEVQAALSVSLDPDGGYTCPPEISSRVASTILSANPLRQLATVETISRNSLQMLDDPNDMVARWVGERAARTETNTPQIGMTEIGTPEMYCFPKSTQQLLDDSTWNMENWLVMKSSRAFVNLERTAFLSGGGAAVNQPRGILTQPTVENATWSWGNIGHILTGVSGAISTTGADLINVLGALEDEYKANASWLMNRATLTAFRQVRAGAAGANTPLLWQPSLIAGQPDTLMGFPLYTSSAMPVQASNANIVLFGDFAAAYTIVDRVGMRVVRDNITEPGFVKFHIYKRVGGNVVNFEAIKMIRCTA